MRWEQSCVLWGTEYWGERHVYSQDKAQEIDLNGDRKKVNGVAEQLKKK